MDATYTLEELADLTGVKPRTIRFYMSEHLLPRPQARGQNAPRGRNAYYTDEHLQRLQLIRRLQDQYLPLEEIKRRIASLSLSEVGELLQETGKTEVSDSMADSAGDYIRRLMVRERSAKPVKSGHPPSRKATQPEAAHAAPRVDAGAQLHERESWERVVLESGLELHVQRPASVEVEQWVREIIELFERRNK